MTIGEVIELLMKIFPFLVEMFGKLFVNIANMLSI